MAEKPSPEQSESGSEHPAHKYAHLMDQARIEMNSDRMVDPQHREQTLDELGLSAPDRELLEHVAARAEQGERLSTVDELTGLPNERGFHQRLQEAEALSRRYELPVHVLMIDMAGLKYFNDTFGYSVGNEALKSVASAMKAVARKGELFTHRSGDEFGAVIFNGTPERLVERLEEELESQPQYTVEGKHPELYFGLATLQPREPIEQTVVRAEDEQKKDKEARREEIMRRLAA